MTKIASLHLSTLSTQQPPYSKADLANVFWNIDFDSLFGDTTSKECLITCKFASKKGVFAHDNAIGTIRANFSSSNSNNNNGVVIGQIKLHTDVESGTFINCIKCNSQLSKGINISIPKGKRDLNIQLIGLNDSLLTVKLDYALSLFFEYE